MISEINQGGEENPQIEIFKQSHLIELTTYLVQEDGYAEYLINNKILHKKILPIIEYGLNYYIRGENYEECAMLVSLKNEINKKI